MDPGWNDPPTFSYVESIERSTKSPKRNVLNKRVPFPMNSAPSSGNTSTFINPTTPLLPNPNLPPPPLANPAAASKVTASTDLPNLADLKVEEKELDNALTDLNILIEEKEDLLKTQNKIEHIKKKVQTLNELWKDNKLPNEVKQRLFEIVEALTKNDKEKANKIQVSLMVDFPLLCGEFISVFRQLINADQ